MAEPTEIAKNDPEEEMQDENIPDWVREALKKEEPFSNTTGKKIDSPPKWMVNNKPGSGPD